MSDANGSDDEEDAEDEAGYATAAVNVGSEEVWHAGKLTMDID
jgi:hypothetical protein